MKTLIAALLIVALSGCGPLSDTVKVVKDDQGRCWYQQSGMAWTEYPCGQHP